MGAGVLKVRFFCFVALLPGTSTRATGVAAAGAALPLITPPKHSFWARSAHPGQRGGRSGNSSRLVASYCGKIIIFWNMKQDRRAHLKFSKRNGCPGLDVPMQVSDDGSVMIVLGIDVGTDWQGRSIPDISSVQSELGAPSNSTGPCHTSTTKEGIVIGCGAPPPPPHMLFLCACDDGGDRSAGSAPASSTARDERVVELQDEGRANYYVSDDANGDDDDGIVFAPRHSNRRGRHAVLWDEDSIFCRPGSAPQHDDSPDWLGGDEGSEEEGRDWASSYACGGEEEGRDWVSFYACGFGIDGVDGGGAAGRMTSSERPRPRSIDNRGGMQVFEADHRGKPGFIDLSRDDDKLTTPDFFFAVVFTATLSAMPIENFDDGARDDFVVDVATGLGVPRDGVRVTGARAGSVIVETSVTVYGGVEAAATFASSLTEPAKPLVDESRFGPCTVSGVRIEEVAAAAETAEAAPVEAPADAAPEEALEPAAAPEPAMAPAEPAPPPARAMTDKNPLSSIVVVFHDNDNNRHPEEQIEGRAGGLRNSVVLDEDGELDEEEEAVRQDSCVAPRDIGGASAAVPVATVGLGLQLPRTVCDDFHAERSAYTGAITRLEAGPVLKGGGDGESSFGPGTRAGGDSSSFADALADCGPAPKKPARRKCTVVESPSPPTLDNASATGCAYDDITKPPPPHLWYVVSPLSSLPPDLRCTVASLPRFLSPTSQG